MLLIFYLNLFIVFGCSNSAKTNLPQVRKSIQTAFENILIRNPLLSGLRETYETFYWLPRRKMPYDSPFVLFKNSSKDFVT